MKRSLWRHVVPCSLAAFFVLGGTLNFFASEDILSDYQRWGYPGWFHYVTAMLEWVAALLLAIPATRIYGSLLGCALMFAAGGTVLIHGEYDHALPPLVVLMLLVLNLFIVTRTKRRKGGVGA
ncbi:DoxX family protein [Allosediminivita pacifica]|uniref:DoxX-like protein n=1 Tax=Allosediminivita pacifica TaxID=1267769 RepID=A0A2T6AJD6_9RHOB|nr:DoxX family protein [Allosediminivita pacifica]PTX43904.1 DoxX-like protein [Allosediminivita pacifica]GGB21804.1 hypothetical protein GCM10011324_34780 [Allosediminivita pacifica]